MLNPPKEEEELPEEGEEGEEGEEEEKKSEDVNCNRWCHSTNYVGDTYNHTEMDHIDTHALSDRPQNRDQ